MCRYCFTLRLPTGFGVTPSTGVQASVCKLLGVTLYPTHQLVEPLHVDDQRSGVVALEGADEYQCIHAGVCQISGGAQERLVQLSECWSCLVFILCCTQFWVRYWPQIFCESDLVESDLFCSRVLFMTDSTIGEVVPEDLQLSEFCLQHSEHVLDDVVSSCDFQIVDVDGHQAYELAFLHFAAEFWVNCARDQSELVSCDRLEFHAEGFGSIDQARSGLVAVKNFFLRVECLEAGHLSQQWYVGRGEVEVDLSRLLAGKFGQFFIGDALQESFGDVSGADVPLSKNGLADQQLLRTAGTGASVPVNVSFVLVFEAT